ncbi:5-oxopent-3-ene-1,2,5-tricarboxylate decarboxylase [Mycolicibacterium murale]|uniref:5-oxopent-3-ene-1,2,5-tricarboxylate decarboxylase n=1 Tax=Mycolicibacterium murale TaxID=182220 RepID=A0A7I9WM19_9MYCO|nr:fumarylacetoacetate hydrolase family protein [Mycolicibacterium murale]MCV7180397.1 fumarylacetoacetate hydrolase family protein [Mycolicibacterium murale]GFG58734.1 5-oxopent-3-ene-1,2,5-tricarboxylate decarboxylase [Mycolicibacterium murale]
MRIFPVTQDDTEYLGVLVDGDTAVLLDRPAGPGSAVLALLSAGPDAIAAAARDVETARTDPRRVVPFSSLELGPVIPDPGKILCVGFNYNAHSAEMEVEPPAAPNVFPKFRNSLVGPRDAIELPEVSTEIDYEGELAIVIGRKCRNVAPEQALDYVAGYTIMNDVSARDLQFRTSQWTLGKAIDTFAPLGPVVTLTDEIPDPQQLQLTTRVNGRVVQDSSTSYMVFGVADIVSTISKSMTLECGDVIATGTPEGVGWKKTPPVFLRDSDVVEVAISGIGTLANPVRHPVSAVAR